MKRPLIIVATLGLIAMSCSAATVPPIAKSVTDQPAVQEIITVVNTMTETVEAPPVEAPTVSPEAAVMLMDTPQMQSSDVTSDFMFSPMAVESTGLALEILSVTSPVKAGENATLKAHTSPGARCAINVYYTSSRSTCEGLAERTVEASGNIAWTWKVGADIAPGVYKIEVSASLGGKSVSQTANFTVSPKETGEAGLALDILSVTAPVKAGESAILKAQTSPGAECKISVYYTSNRSTAEGLITKKAEASGNVTWIWKVGTDMAAGSYRIEVTASLNGQTASKTTNFSVTK
jgi:5-hydroxyisourate hydrolase-like protein (transthyretin family)